MTETHAPTLMDQILDEAARPNPWPLYAQLRKTPVARQPDGTYVVSGYDEIVALLHDPRISSDAVQARRVAAPAAARSAGLHRHRPARARHPAPRDHVVLRPAAPPRPGGEPRAVDARDASTASSTASPTATQIDVVDDFAYPFPVSAICRILGVPPEDEPKFHDWSGALIVALGLRFQPEGQPGGHPGGAQGQPGADRLPGRAGRGAREGSRRRHPLGPGHRQRPRRDGHRTASSRRPGCC